MSNESVEVLVVRPEICQTSDVGPLSCAKKSDPSM
jgi:hypothetical protein